MCLSVCLFKTKFHPNRCTDFDEIFAKWLLATLTRTYLNWWSWVKGQDQSDCAFMSHKKILWLFVFVHPFLSKQNSLRNQDILCFFMGFGPRRSFYEKSSGGQNLDVENFQFQITSKPFDQSTSYLVWWYKKMIDIYWYIFRWLDSRSKVKEGQTGCQLNMGSYLKTYLTQRLHTWYQDTTQ